MLLSLGSLSEPTCLPLIPLFNNLKIKYTSSSVYLFNNRTVQIQWQRWYKWSWNGNDKADSTYSHPRVL